MLACVCPTGTYFSLSLQACVSYTALGQICVDSTNCQPNATCLWQNATADMRCQCTVSSYYQASTTSCLFLREINETCTSSVQCDNAYGLFCVNGYCSCVSNYFWNGAFCQVQMTYNSYSSYSQSC